MSRRSKSATVENTDALEAHRNLADALAKWAAFQEIPLLDPDRAAAAVKSYLSGMATFVMDQEPQCPGACLISERTLRLFEVACLAGNRNVDPDSLFDLVQAAGQLNAARALDRTVRRINDDDVPF